MIRKNNQDVVKYCIQNSILKIRGRKTLISNTIPPQEDIIRIIGREVEEFSTKSLRNVINATGVVVHTNLGRAPFSDDIIDEAADIFYAATITWSFDLEKGERIRNTHLTNSYLTGAEDVLVVN
ncbi:MAG: hypothetical protein R2764_00340 [Bacteroidales bacterium]